MAGTELGREGKEAWFVESSEEEDYKEGAVPYRILKYLRLMAIVFLI